MYNIVFYEKGNSLYRCPKDKNKTRKKTYLSTQYIDKLRG